MKTRYAQLLEEYNETFYQLKAVKNLSEFDRLMLKARRIESEIQTIIWNKNHESERNERK